MGAMTETTVRQGRVRGVGKEGYTVFMGIPYAAPPVGDLRFCAPKEAACWEGVYDADHFGKTCWQKREDKGSFYEREFYHVPAYQTGMDEDCLYLNIWTPAKTIEERLPVAFWVHGGAFDHGTGHEMEFDGAGYAKRGVILVSINYRVGVLGFLAHPWLSAEDKDGVSGNYGILDQIAALKWVRENIGAFGGDAHNITVFGQSAGAMSVQTLISSPLTEDWIAKAIMQSGGGYEGPFQQDRVLARAEEIGQQFVGFCGVKSLKELREMEPLALLQKQNAFISQQKGFMLAFAPNIDGILLEKGYNACVEEGLIKDIPYMIGSTLNDITVDPKELSLGKRGPLYEGCVRFSRMLEKLGRQGAYVYDFRRQLPGGDGAGAFHSSELWYMFGTYPRCWRPFSQEDEKLSGQMLDAWTGFMKNGHPGNGWEPCSGEQAYVQGFDVLE